MAKSSGTQKKISQNPLIKILWYSKQNFFFFSYFNKYENFKMEVEQMSFVTHLIITVQIILFFI